MGRRVGAGRSATAASRLPRRRQQLLQPLADESAPADGAGEQVGFVGVVHLAVVEFLQRLLALAPRDVTGRFVIHLLGRPTVGRNHLLGANHAETLPADRRARPCPPRWTATRRASRCGAPRRDRPATSTHRAAGHRSRRAPGGPRPPDSAWPAADAEPARPRRPGSRLPAAISDACTATDSRFARARAEGSTKTVCPSVHDGSPDRAAPPRQAGPRGRTPTCPAPAAGRHRRHPPRSPPTAATH